MVKRMPNTTQHSGGMLRTLIVAAIGFGFGATLTRQGPFHDAPFLLETSHGGRGLAHDPQANVRTAATVSSASEKQTAEVDCSRETEKAVDLQKQITKLQEQQSNALAVQMPVVDAKYCREKVFNTKQLTVSDDTIDGVCNQPNVYRCYDVCRDLADFTGLTMEEVITRMKRMKHFHFEQEHQFWDPQTPTQLAWYYSTSQSYLFANAIHSARYGILGQLKKGVHEPVLDYSGGVGNSVLFLAIEKGMKCQYFGIGMIEKEFTQFRVAKKGLQDLITFVNPWSEQTGHKFDPIKALPRDASLGSILATDVLEHIPNYHIVVKAMVDSLKVGGVIVEETPFAEKPVGGSSENDLRIHVHNGGISMAEAMGDRMIHHPKEKYWEKIKL